MANTIRSEMRGLELLRRMRGWRQCDVAAAIDQPTSYVSYLERGLRPTEKQLKALCALFGLPESDSHKLLDYYPAPEPEVPPPPDMTERILEAREREREEREARRRR